MKTTSLAERLDLLRELDDRADSYRRRADVALAQRRVLVRTLAPIFADHDALLHGRLLVRPVHDRDGTLRDVTFRPLADAGEIAPPAAAAAADDPKGAAIGDDDDPASPDDDGPWRDTDVIGLGPGPRGPVAAFVGRLPADDPPDDDDGPDDAAIAEAAAHAALADVFDDCGGLAIGPVS